MKTFIVAVMCLLAVADAHSVTPGLLTLHTNLKECAKEHTQCENNTVEPLISCHAWFCHLQRVGVIDENDAIIREEGIKYCEAIIPSNHVPCCKKFVASCIDTKDQMSGFNDKKSLSIAKICCIILHGVMSFIDY